MIHRAHGDVHEVGLQDHCDGCEEIAERPIANADTLLLQFLTVLAVDRERLVKIRSTNEGVATAKILTLLEQVGKLSEIAPTAVEEYLRERWHLDASIKSPMVARIQETRERLGL